MTATVFMQIRKLEIKIGDFELKLGHQATLVSTKQSEISSLSDQVEKLGRSLNESETRLVDTNLSWERKLEEANQKRTKAKDKLVQQLASTKDKLENEVKYLRGQIQKRATLDERVREEEQLKAKVQDLQSQNAQMADVIRQMRNDMEALQKEIPVGKLVSAYFLFSSRRRSPSLKIKIRIGWKSRS